ncbi:hypothetical protein, partial [Bacteroides gallinaceum]|uniref:hypothetical protein n=1 Tax=Bacteroides gallinaceum TaxID=1462571 RepID=UPI00195DC37C
RTEKLSFVTPMVLRNSGRVGSRRFGVSGKCGCILPETPFFISDRVYNIEGGKNIFLELGNINYYLYLCCPIYIVLYFGNA